MNIEFWPVTKPVPYGRNPRVISTSAVAKVKASLKEFGFKQPIVVDQDGVIVVGHTRHKAAIELGLETVPVLVAADLTPAQIKAYRIADNRTNEEAEWDNDLLAIELDDLKVAEFDTLLTGFDPDELTRITAPGITEGLTDDDAVPEAPEHPKSKPGDIWLLDNHRLMCGDSTSVTDVEKLMGGLKADMVFTDPPYGVDYDGGHAVKGIRREKLRNDGTPDIYADVLPLIASYSQPNSPLYLWFADSKALAVLNALGENAYDVRSWIIWNKNLAQFGAIGAQYKTKHEPCLYCFKKGTPPYWCGPTNEITVWDVDRSTKNEFHPTQKPVALAERALANSCKMGGVVLDLFGGSGSTLIACEKTGRSCRMMELDPKYADVIVRRWQAFSGKQAVHVDGTPFDERT